MSAVLQCVPGETRLNGMYANCIRSLLFDLFEICHEQGFDQKRVRPTNAKRNNSAIITQKQNLTAVLNFYVKTVMFMFRIE